MVRELIDHGAVRTTRAKANSVRGLVEKLITRAKRATNMDRNRIRSEIADKKTEAMLLSDAKTRFASRTSGYTRIVKLAPRLGDNTQEVLLSLVDAKPEPVVVKKEKEPAKKRTTKK